MALSPNLSVFKQIRNGCSSYVKCPNKKTFAKKFWLALVTQLARRKKPELLFLLFLIDCK